MATTYAIGKIEFEVSQDNTFGQWFLYFTIDEKPIHRLNFCPSFSTKESAIRQGFSIAREAQK